MTDKPILFSGPMVRALLEGRKTQTRRVLKPQPFRCDERSLMETKISFPIKKNDRLWVREGFVTGFDIDDEFGRPVGEKRIWYRATDGGLTWFDTNTESTIDNPPWKPSIHMPRLASRLTLTVTDVRVQRLQDISEDDAIDEGIETDVWDQAPVAKRYGTDGWFVGWSMGVTEPSISVDADEVGRCSFRSLWDTLNASRGFGWDANPWVAAYSFTVERRNIDQFAKEV